jgi:hypothetical protein
MSIYPDARSAAVFHSDFVKCNYEGSREIRASIAVLIAIRRSGIVAALLRAPMLLPAPILRPAFVLSLAFTCLLTVFLIARTIPIRVGLLKGR